MNKTPHSRLPLVVMTSAVCLSLSCDPGLQSEEVISVEAETIQLTKSSPYKQFPSWSPDGRFIAYTQQDRGTLISKLSTQGRRTEPVLREDDEYTDVTLSPDGRAIVYVVRSTGELVLRSLENNTTKTLAAAPQQIFGPVWSPDGSLIAYSVRSSSTEVALWIVNVEGGIPQKLTQDDQTYLCGSFSADGKKIALYSKRSGNWEIWIINTENGELRQLTFPPSQKRFPAWSPDGSTIAYVSYEDTCYSNYSTILLMPASGGQARQLVLVPGRISHLAWSPDGSTLASADRSLLSFIAVSSGEVIQRYYVEGERPTWFPDGLSLLVSRVVPNYTARIVSVQDLQTTKLSDVKIDTAFYPVWVNENEIAFVRARDILKIPITGGNAMRLTHNANLSPRDMEISPDRSQVAFAYGGDIFVQSLQGEPPANLTGHISEWLDEPAWSPDGQHLVCRYYAGLKIFALVSDKLVERKILPGYYYGPAWSPSEAFGSLIAFENLGNIYLATLEEAEPKLAAANGQQPAWSPDGRWLAYIRESDIFITKVFDDLK